MEHQQSGGDFSFPAIRSCQLYQDTRFLDHFTGAHPESRDRLRTVSEYLAKVELPGNIAVVSAMAAPHFQPLIQEIHPPTYLQQLQRFAAHGGGRWDADTVVSPESYDTASLAAMTAAQAVDEVLTGKTGRAFCLLRPPGHHAVTNNAMGFCLLNNVAIAARRAIQQHGLRRVLIIDWDVHHGNGTQDIFYDNEQVWFFSVHRHPFYPGSGQAEETGTGAGLGCTFNLPFSEQISRRDYLAGVMQSLTHFAERCQPELILLSAGFDAHRRDPIGSLGLETEDFQVLTRFVCQLAEACCRGKIVSLLEGGYHLQALAESVEAHLRELAVF